MVTYLGRILAAHKAAAAADTRPLDRLVEAGRRAAEPTRGFRAALTADSSLAVIAEIKRRSPSKGELAPDLVAAVLAKSYEAGGAACLSVVTDREFFGGDRGDLSEARAATLAHDLHDLAD